MPLVRGASGPDWTVYFDAVSGGQGHAMCVSLGAVIGIGILSCPAVPLLPRQAQAKAGH